MIDELNGLKNKTSELESKLLVLSHKQDDNDTQTKCISFNRKFSNLEIILSKKILISRIEPKNKSNILFQCLLDLTLMEEESVEISFIVDNFSIYKTQKILGEGSNQISIMQNFQPFSTKKISVYVEITPLTQKQILLNNISLFAWGNMSKDTLPVYQAIETNQNYLISMLDSNCIYYASVDKTINEYNLSDLIYLDTAISYSLVYSQFDGKLYLFRVDLYGNLFYSEFTSNREIFLMNNVSYVSADVDESGKFLVAYVKDNQCFYLEIDENMSISIQRKLFCNYVAVSRVLCYYNSFSEKFILLFSSQSDNNFFVEELSEDYLSNNSLNANYSFYITEGDVL